MSFGKDKKYHDVDEDAGEEMTEKAMRELLSKISNSIDQVNSLYTQYLSGIEKRPPHDKRKNIEMMIDKVSRSQKTKAQLVFEWNSLHSRYTTQRTRWDRMLRDLESGRIQRGRPGAGGRGPATG